MEDFGIPEANIDNERNGLLLGKGLEDAFDHLQVCFLYDFLHKKLVLHVANRSPEFLKKKVYPSTSLTFEEIDGKTLQCPHGKMPYRRVLSWHAYLTLQKHGQLQERNFKPYHRLSEEDKSYAFPEDVDPEWLQQRIDDGAEASEKEDQEQD